MGLSAKSPLEIWVPGGLAAQLNGLAYALFLALEHQLPVNLQIDSGGRQDRQLTIRALLETRTVIAQRISFEEEEYSYALKSQAHTKYQGAITQAFLLRARQLSQRLLFQKDLHLADLTLNDLEQLPSSGSLARGYPNDFEVAERMLTVLSEIIGEAGLQNFLADGGAEDSVAIHWRIGDYLGNPFHGTYPWSTFDLLLDTHLLGNMQVKIFTDTPEFVDEAVKNSSKRSQISIESGDIWQDLYSMTRSRIFIGSHSGISLWAAMGLLQEGSRAKVFLPKRWFVHAEDNGHFHPPPRTWRLANKFEADLHV